MSIISPMEWKHCEDIYDIVNNILKTDTLSKFKVHFSKQMQGIFVYYFCNGFLNVCVSNSPKPTAGVLTMWSSLLLHTVTEIYNIVGNEKEF